VVAQDPSAKVRAAAAAALAAMIETGRAYMAAADERCVACACAAGLSDAGVVGSAHQPSSFMPLSATLGVVVREMHAGLLSACAETNQPVLLQVLRVRAKSERVLRWLMCARSVWRCWCPLRRTTGWRPAISRVWLPACCLSCPIAVRAPHSCEPPLLSADTALRV
jgi:hypothetical protein